jgi:hypothetical protein
VKYNLINKENAYGRLLIASVMMLSTTEEFSSKTPDEILEHLELKATETLGVLEQTESPGPYGMLHYGRGTFGEAVNALKKGQKVCRSGWNGKGMFLFLVPGSTFTVNRPPLLGIYPEGTEINYCSHIDMKTADDKVVPWLASQTDVLAEDWLIVE